ncbi:DUF3396 domain-containing protein [Burkholderia pseudomallei]|nr:DUF3396 domain-containing protein [Burkholderia pseudomallei]RPE15321.1 DUF3396 domain-containing protein [Burkholderia pseudomallei]RQS80842.1 DUF3396 domain-containing protein [Burkholderia pseudomallei]RQZ42069.1 DUF3396 domain-containing protein [Burkholderia pseudomallei]RSK54955.1 DUF3396 domain-containing protein [Burkholderia pseudomallei]
MSAFIVEGDTTSHGGHVFGCASISMINGMRIARLGDMVSCPKCGGAYPGANAERDLRERIKSVDWLTAISKDMLDRVGGVRALRSELPPDWFSIGDYGAGVLIRAGVFPESGLSNSEGEQRKSMSLTDLVRAVDFATQGNTLDGVVE